MFAPASPGEIVDDYKELIEAVISRQLGILGKENLSSLLEKTDLGLNDRFRLSNGKCGIDDLENLMKKLKKHYGSLAILGCRMHIIRLANKQNLKLPRIFD